MTTGIELRHLKHFAALAEELHFGRAARLCNISQPPFSVSIRQLEEQLGFALVERSSRDVRLTPAGTAFYSEACKALSQVRQAADVAARVHGGLDGVLCVGFFASMLYRGLDRAVDRFRATYPTVDLQLLELSTSDQIPALLRRHIHYGFVHSTRLPAEIAAGELLREPFLLCLPERHPARHRRRQKLADFRAEPFVLFSRTFSPSYYDQVVARCLAAGFHPDIKHQVRHWLTVVACVSKGMGITLVPRALSRADLPGVRFSAIEDSTVESIVHGAWLKGDGDSAIVQAWHRVVRQEIGA
ncbi:MULTISPECIES: LysR substrate-binding domain-containing protein [Bordetella]|uniref:LysR-family transcriptional regulator n=2 Tax=Bordetella TaxID=517 RepID=K0MHV3_BORPB|nr:MULTISPECIES: LysR substrate-binding domain-containing protein [Bordetella]KAK65994.1 LysR substrate-binding domain protein [Bordetella bronchiseptica 980-2]KCV26597.1 LysR substrate-binding domain protein [Bordetella bronchiseptica 00-P-2730]KDD53078.1 LysR substrate-binding domain protein [Bordetella bronchiseptica OSU553]AMG87515.1 LysR family transcriptional regulator [Bordetella bronchiseptica]AUL14288.1 LysR family transcriptional regulator [Bordetella bronchiseptica]